MIYLVKGIRLQVVLLASYPLYGIKTLRNNTDYFRSCVIAFSVRNIQGYDVKDPVLKTMRKQAHESGYVWASETFINKWLS